MGQILSTNMSKKVSPFSRQQEWESEYDSTWEDDDKQKQKRRQKQFHLQDQRYTAARDLQNYRHGYPKIPCQQGEMSNVTPNLDFYQNKKCFKPKGVLIEELLTRWKNDYNRLEMNHLYIPWLFPLQEAGRNPDAKPLTIHEIQIMQADEDVMGRFLESYKLMLGFYGITLLDEKTGEVTRAKNWEKRFKNLNNRSHNNLRITRILKCLGELGYENFQVPLVRFFLEETLREGQLQNVKKSVLDYFIFTVKNKRERRNLVHFAWVHYEPKDGFMWGPVEKLRDYVPPEEKEIKKE
ncbi:opioid growth factor receptor-like [Mixophyes fleayi]|uniref:opioid growth factor receptor-like n=1 Tax=Mixophyes fleayi TaxID=3061075 RepID=UPI003F4DF4F2